MVAPDVTCQKCPVCCKKEHLVKCSVCKVVSYCGKEHRTEHRAEHEAVCKAVKQARIDLEREEAELRASPPGFPVGDVFKTRVGEFWSIRETRKYIRARFKYARELLNVDTHLALEMALEHLMGLLRLSRDDKLNIRDIVPSIMIRLGKDQECYDFIKWWTSPQTKTSNWRRNMKVPFLDTRGADPFESVDDVCKDHSLNTSFLINLTLLKLRFHLELGACAEERSNAAKGISSAPVRHFGSVVKSRVASLKVADIRKKAKLMETQYKQLVKAVHYLNPYFWTLLVERTIPVRSQKYSRCSIEEAHLLLEKCALPWDDADDAIDLVDLETLPFVSVYQGPVDLQTQRRLLEGIKTEPTPALPDKRRGTGKIFPTAIKPLVFRASGGRYKSTTNAEMAVVLVDGACLGNGTFDAYGGWAVNYGKNRVLSGPLETTGPFGGPVMTATSNRAELRAAIAALRMTNWRDDGYTELCIVTDSAYVVDGATSWVKGWVKNGWTTRAATEVKNRDLWELLLAEVERYSELGVGVSFGKIPREDNTIADKAAKQAAEEAEDEPVYKFRDVQIPKADSTNPSIKPYILVLSFDTPFRSHKDIHAKIASKAHIVEAKTRQEALDLLAQEKRPSTILATDAGFARYGDVWERVIDHLRAGSNVILAGYFSSTLTMARFNRLFAKVGLPWRQGSYQTGKVILHSTNIRKQIPNLYSRILTFQYKPRALCVTGFEESAIWYRPAMDYEQAMMLRQRVGAGMLAYVGDANWEEPTVQSVALMCGLLDMDAEMLRPRMLGPSVPALLDWDAHGEDDDDDEDEDDEYDSGCPQS